MKLRPGMSLADWDASIGSSGADDKFPELEEAGDTINTVFALRRRKSYQRKLDSKQGHRTLEPDDDFFSYDGVERDSLRTEFESN